MVESGRRGAITSPCSCPVLLLVPSTPRIAVLKSNSWSLEIQHDPVRSYRPTQRQRRQAPATGSPSQTRAAFPSSPPPTQSMYYISA
jgi:hypothetical protein